jgi:uncharacterized phage protein gp47/JayE
MSTLFADRQTLFQVGRRAIVGTPNIRINPAVVDIPGSDLNLAVGIDSVIGEEVVSRGAAAMRGAFAELARKSQLDRVIYDRSGLMRFSATPANVDLVLTRPTPGSATPGVYSSGSVVKTADGTIQFGLNTDVTFGNYDVTKTVSATATVAGEDTNAPAGTVTAFSTPPFDATLTITNPKSAAGGTDAEDDIPFLGRYRAFFPTLSKATLGAIEYGAMQVPGVAVATATEIINPSSGFPAAINQLVIGDKFGNADSTTIQKVSDKLLEYRAGGLPVIVIGGTVVYQSVRWQLAFQTGFDEDLCVSRVRAITVAIAQFLPPGPANGILYRSSLIAAAKQVPGVIVSDSSLLFPLGDVVPESVEKMIRIPTTSVTFG